MKWLALTIGFLALAGCGADPALIQRISNASITVDTSRCPARVRADITAAKGACDEPLPPAISRDGKSVTVTLEVERTAEVCIEVIEEYSQTVELGEFEPGDYQLVVKAAVEDFSEPFRVDGACRP